MTKVWPWWVLLAVCGVLIRVAVLWGYEPHSYPDTGTYLTAARDLLTGDYSAGQGRRTPGYPMFIAALGEDPRAIMLAQFAAGLLTATLLFFIALMLTGSAPLSFAAGLSYHLNLQQVFVEAALATEAVSTLSVVAVVAVLLAAIRRLRQGRSVNVLLGLLGLLVGIAVLIRPQFIFLPLLVPALIIAASLAAPPQRRWWQPRAAAIGRAVLVTLPAALLIFGWSSLLWSKVGHFALSTQAGFGLVNHSVAFVEFAPDRYAAFRDILLKHREQRIAIAGHPGNTIWYAWPEIQAATGLSLPEASRELQSMSTELFAAHPWRYARSVAEAWVSFWTVPIMWDPDRLQPLGRAEILQAVWWVEHKALRLANLVFVLTVAGVVISRALRRRLQWNLGLTAISAVVLSSSLVQALADQGAASRYLVTTQALVVVLLLVVAYRANGRRTLPSGRSKGSRSPWPERTTSAPVAPIPRTLPNGPGTA